MILLASGFLLTGSLLIVSQQPWRRLGEMHTVGSTLSAGIPISVIQVYGGGGLNSSYVVSRKDVNSKWKWFCIGNDDLYGYQVRFNHQENADVEVIKYGKVFAVFSPETFKLRWFNVDQSPSYETTELSEFNDIADDR